MELTIPLPWQHFKPLDDLEPGTVNHDGHTADGRIGCQQIEEGLHLLPGIEQTVVHIDIDDHGSVLHLLAGNVERLVVVFLADEPQELPAACHIAALAHLDKCPRIGFEQRQAREPQGLHAVL